MNLEMGEGMHGVLCVHYTIIAPHVSQCDSHTACARCRFPAPLASSWCKHADLSFFTSNLKAPRPSAILSG